ncbi:MAG: peptidoglycan/LPS O-acetylase OafA/YrhL [Psychroserpens sp.]
MNKLSFFSQGRLNNFNLIRFVAATLVLITHSYVLFSGSGEAEPFRNFLGMTLGTLAVDAFFVTSGFLIASSYFRQSSLFSFVVARALRIYPALIVALLFIIFAVGSFFTNLSIDSYLFDPVTIQYFFRNTFLFFGVDFSLPGVFLTNPYPDNVNGSLWTMPYEVIMYFLLAIIGLIFSGIRFIGKELIVKLCWMILFVISIFFYYLSLSDITLSLSDISISHKFFRLFSLFFIGASIFYFREYIVLSTILFLVSVASLFLVFISQAMFHYVYIFSFPYIVLFLAYVPRGFILKFNNIGDYSYGIYIYAWPIQQAIIASFPSISLLSYVFFSFMITLFFAYLSWNYVESPALRLKSKFSKMSKQQKREVYSD